MHLDRPGWSENRDFEMLRGRPGLEKIVVMGLPNPRMRGKSQAASFQVVGSQTLF
jgi:hypothetical protein